MTWRFAADDSVTRGLGGRDLFELVFIEAGEGSQRIGPHTYHACTGTCF
ncbi:MAG: hypothetical protein H0T58_05480 [Gemmatimonadales bacterium]|nr:hypothetical protein [Gemmatimonadales bacterium]